MITVEQIKQLASSQFNRIRLIRQHLHKNPELSFKEYQTQAYVIDRLQEIGITQITKLADTGVVAIIEGINPEKKTIALRADMDALPIVEQNKTSYTSIHSGVMHACGHDVHTANLLGAASILFELKGEFEGRIKLVFQPGEEKLPGGASIMIKEGVLENPQVNSMIGLHVMPLLPVGTVGFRKGLYMASTDELYITIKGKGGHGAMPHLNVDPVLIAAHLITGLQQIVSRNANPIVPSVLSFGKVIANGATNVIPEQVQLEGTFRTLDEPWRAKAHENMIKLATAIVEGMGGTIEFEIRKGYPFLYNNEHVTMHAQQAAKEYLGDDKVVDLDIWMAAEDFAFYSQQVPATFYRLGTRNESKGIVSSVHTPTFDIDEDALEIGIGLTSWIAIQELQR